MGAACASTEASGSRGSAREQRGGRRLRPLRGPDRVRISPNPRPLEQSCRGGTSLKATAASPT
eukprot:2548422-Alexandrium_andersonii.AAC.1